jgi:hypothetical protein
MLEPYVDQIATLTILVKVMIIQKLVRTQQNNNTQRKQCNRKNLQNKEKLKQYRHSFHNKLEIAEECKMLILSGNRSKIQY